MKKTLFTLMVVSVSHFSCGQAKIELGLKAGVNFADTDLDNSESITAFHGGAYGLIKFANIGIQPEMLWSKQGSEFSVFGSTDEIDFTYVNIPVMLKFYLPLGLNLQIGPQFGILTNAENEDGNDIKDNFKNSDLSAALGAGWDAPFGLQFTARYVLGLSDVEDVGGDSVRNRTFQLAIGYSLFRLGK